MNDGGISTYYKEVQTGETHRPDHTVYTMYSMEEDGKSLLNMELAKQCVRSI